MTDPDTISADYTLRPSELAATLALLVEARQPTLVWGPPGTAKSMIAQQVAADAGRSMPNRRNRRGSMATPASAPPSRSPMRLTVARKPLFRKRRALPGVRRSEPHRAPTGANSRPGRTDW